MIKKISNFNILLLIINLIFSFANRLLRLYKQININGIYIATIRVEIDKPIMMPAIANHFQFFSKYALAKGYRDKATIDCKIESLGLKKPCASSLG